MNLPFMRCCWQLAIGSPNNDRGFFCRLCAHQNAAGPAPCETYPSRPKTMVLPFAAGSDRYARPNNRCQNASFARVVVWRRTNPEAELDRIDLQHRLDTKEHVPRQSIHNNKNLELADMVGAAGAASSTRQSFVAQEEKATAKGRL